MKLRLNLATTPLENNRRFVLSSTLTGAIALISLAALGTTAFGHWRANRALREEISRMDSEMRDFRSQRRELEEFFKQPEARSLTDRANFLNAMIEQRSFPWTQIFSRLEKRLPPGVRVVSIAPQMHDGRVQLRMVFSAATDESKLRFIQALEEAPEFSRLQLISETRPKGGDAQDGILVEVSALYVSTPQVQQMEAAEAGTSGEAGPAAGPPPGKAASAATARNAVPGRPH